jgi:hypothetical protein
MWMAGVSATTKPPDTMRVSGGFGKTGSGSGSGSSKQQRQQWMQQRQEAATRVSRPPVRG